MVRGAGDKGERQREVGSQQTDRQTDKHTDRQTDRQIGRQADRQAGRQTDRQTDRQTGRQAGRQMDNSRETTAGIQRLTNGTGKGVRTCKQHFQPEAVLVARTVRVLLCFNGRMACQRFWQHLLSLAL
eukprot:COSAG03_NODE_5696_length_1194_cov_1.692237_2_plen_128_part_00